MKNKLIIIIVPLLIVLTHTKIFCADWFNPAIKLGVNFNKSHYSINDLVEKYHYPLGLSIGISNKIGLKQSFYISNDFYYKYKQSKMHIYCATPEWNFLLYKTEYVRVSTLLGIKHIQFLDILIGFDFGKLLRADYIISNDKNPKPNNTDEFEITETVSNFDVSLCMGISKSFRINKLKFVTEMKYFAGLKKYKYFSPIGGIRQKFRNHNLDFDIGFIF